MHFPVITTFRLKVPSSFLPGYLEFVSHIHSKAAASCLVFSLQHIPAEEASSMQMPIKETWFIESEILWLYRVCQKESKGVSWSGSSNLLFFFSLIQFRFARGRVLPSTVSMWLPTRIHAEMTWEPLSSLAEKAATCNRDQSSLDGSSGGQNLPKKYDQK